MHRKHPSTDRPVQRLAPSCSLLCVLLFITALLTACGAQPTMDSEGLRDRANQETDQVR